MADITKCTGDHCPMKDKCYRHTASNSEWQSWFTTPPGKWAWERTTHTDGTIFDQRIFKCDMYWGEQQDVIMDTLNTIFNGIQDDKI